MGEWRALLPMASRLSRSTDTLGVRTRYSYECRVFHCSLTRPWLGCRCSGWLRRRSGAAGPVLSISHVIPSRLFQTLNSQRWNCNVLRRSRKVTVGNYVRGYSVKTGGIFGKCDGLNVSEPTGILATARGYPCRRVVSWAYLQVNHDITTPSGIRRNLSETCRG